MTKFVDFTSGYVKINTDQRDNLTEAELRSLEAIAQVCDPHLFSGVNISSGLKASEIVPLLKSITVSLNETTLFCKWRNQVALCDEFFTEIITEEGFCYTFNILNSSELFKEDVYEIKLDYFKFLNNFYFFLTLKYGRRFQLS